MKTLTDFGDLAVLLPLAAAMLVWLLLVRQAKSAIWWIVAVALCVGVTAALKIYFSACPLSAELQSPSGHTSLSTLVYGGIALVAAPELGAWRRYGVAAAGTAFILAIAASRVILEAHTPLETITGLPIGGIALALFGSGYLRGKATNVSLLPLLLASLLIAVVMNGRQFAAEGLLRALAVYLSAAAPLCT
jgi:membrane-associated phospholipid phosphatase